MLARRAEANFRGEVDRLVCATRPDPPPLHLISLFLSLFSSSFSFSVSLSFLCSPRDFLKSLFQARPRTGRGARPAFLPSDTTLLNLNLLRSSANRRLAAREKYFKKERAFLVIVSSQPGYSNLANLLPGKLDPELFHWRSCTLIQNDGLVKVNKM